MGHHGSGANRKVQITKCLQKRKHGVNSYQQCNSKALEQEEISIPRRNRQQEIN